MPEKAAIGSSLTVVGTAALAGAALQARHDDIVGRCILAFGVPGIAGAAVGGLAAGRVPGSVQMAVFATLALAAAAPMLRGAGAGREGALSTPLPAIAGAGSGMAALSPLAGVGGGFLLVPALMRFGHLAIPQAIATRLALIAVNASTGVGSTGSWPRSVVSAGAVAWRRLCA